ENYPPELGLYMSVLEATGLHGEAEAGDCSAFAAPSGDDPANLAPLWADTDAWLTARADGATAAEVFDLWRSPPYGLRDGLLPVLFMAYLLSRASQSAVYLDGVFRPSLDTLLVDRLLQDPAKVSVRAVELSEVDVAFIAEMAQALSGPSAPVAPTPLDVARTLVAEVRALPSWTLRTTHLSPQALKLRDRSKSSDDPNRLLLEDLPAAIGLKPGELAGARLARKVGGLLKELREAYPAMLRALEAVLLGELRVRAEGDAPYAALHRRAEGVRGLTGNYRLDALATRLAQYGGRTDDIEGLASLAANRPPKDWVDRDVDNARVELAALAQQFLKAELYVHLKDREGGRIALGIYISDPRYPEPRAQEFELSAAERREGEELAARIGAFIAEVKASREVALAALASLGLSLNGAVPLEGAVPEAAE
ncbi:MAG: ATP-binding protein, partial [Pseudomonadota bacterium]